MQLADIGLLIFKKHGITFLAFIVARVLPQSNKNHKQNAENMKTWQKREMKIINRPYFTFTFLKGLLMIKIKEGEQYGFYDRL